MRNHSNNLLPVIVIAAIIISLCCYLLVLCTSNILIHKSFDRYMDKSGMVIPEVSCFYEDMKFLSGQDYIDLGNIFLKSGSIVFASFKDVDNPRKGFKFEIIGTSEIADRLNKTADWLDSLELYSYPLRTFVDKDMPMKEVLPILYRIRSSRPRVTFVLRDRDTSGYVYFNYRIADSIATAEAYKSLHLHSVQVSKESDSFAVLWQGEFKRNDVQLTEVFEDMLSSHKDHTLIVNIEEMTFEDYISVVYEYVRIVHKHRNDYCLKTYGKPFEEGALDYTKLTEAKALFPQNVLLHL